MKNNGTKCIRNCVVASTIIYNFILGAPNIGCEQEKYDVARESIKVSELETISNNIDLSFCKGAKYNPNGNLMEKGLTVYCSELLEYSVDSNDDNLGITHYMENREIAVEHLYFDEREVGLNGKYFRTSGEQVPLEDIIGIKPEQLEKGAHKLVYKAIDLKGNKIEDTAILLIK